MLKAGLELEWQSNKLGLTCHGCRKDLPNGLSISTDTRINPVIWLRLCKDCITTIYHYIEKQEVTDDEWLTTHGFVETKCFYCQNPVVMLANEYSKYGAYKCTVCEPLSDKELEQVRSMNVRTK